MVVHKENVDLFLLKKTNKKGRFPNEKANCRCLFFIPNEFSRVLNELEGNIHILEAPNCEAPLKKYRPIVINNHAKSTNFEIINNISFINKTLTLVSKGFYFNR